MKVGLLSHRWLHSGWAKRSRIGFQSSGKNGVLTSPAHQIHLRLRVRHSNQFGLLFLPQSLVELFTKSCSWEFRGIIELILAFSDLSFGDGIAIPCRQLMNLSWVDRILSKLVWILTCREVVVLPDFDLAPVAALMIVGALGLWVLFGCESRRSANHYHIWLAFANGLLQHATSLSRLLLEGWVDAVLFVPNFGRVLSWFVDPHVAIVIQSYFVIGKDCARAFILCYTSDRLSHVRAFVDYQ